MRARFILGCSLALTGVASAQGTVQARDPRRPPPLQRSARCEVWEGTISGNDPTAQASMQVCREGGARVTGVFLWSSLQSGWNRRAFEGEWSDDGQTLTLRDTRMIESHPLNGWLLCTADRYVLRRAAATRLDGTYDSDGCTDHGTLSMTLRGEGEIPSRPPSVDPPAREDAPRRRARCSCAAAPRTSARSIAATLAIFALASRGLSRRASRPR
ncbi:MAG: hypothetical protein R3A48_06655 [Polyangiales bacterium]